MNMNKKSLLCLAIILGGRAAVAQLVSVGVVGGVHFGDLTSARHDESRPYLVGPSVEFRLPAGFAIEADALYQRVGGTSTYGFSSILTGTSLSALPANSFIVRQRGNSWEFPLLGKYYFGRRETGWQPFLGTGWAFRTATEHQSGSAVTTDASGVSHLAILQNNFRSDLAVGAVFAAGARLRAGRLVLTPEVRYTRWGTSEGFFRKNEAGFLLGLRF